MLRAFWHPKHVHKTPLNAHALRKLKRLETYYLRLMNDRTKLVSDLKHVLIHQIIPLSVRIMLYVMLFLVTTRLRYKTHVLESSLRRNLSDQNKEQILGKFFFQSTSRYHDVRTLHEDQHVQLVHHSIEELIVIRREPLDVVDQN